MAGTPAGGTVTMACKHPSGLLLRVFEQDSFDVPVLGGGMRKETRGVAVGEPVRVHGPAVPYGQAPKYIIAGGYALTPNVPADFARKWMEQNKDNPIVKNQVVFIMDKQEDARAKAKEQVAVKSGLEPLEPGTVRKNGRDEPRDPRWPKSRNPNLTDVVSDSNKDRDVA
jgi:hypothetical protein